MLALILGIKSRSALACVSEAKVQTGFSIRSERRKTPGFSARRGFKANHLGAEIRKQTPAEFSLLYRPVHHSKSS